MKTLVSALLTYAFLGTAELSTRAATLSFSEISELPIGSAERALTYATNRVTRFVVYILGEVPMNWSKGFVWEGKRFYQGEPGRVPSQIIGRNVYQSQSLGEAAKSAATSYMSRTALVSNMLTFADGLTVNPDTHWFLLRVSAASTNSTYFFANKLFQLERDGQGFYRIPLNVVLSEPFLEFPTWDLRIQIGTSVERLTIRTFDQTGQVSEIHQVSRDTNSVVGEYPWGVEDGTLEIPLRFAFGVSGDVTVAYTSDLRVCDKFDLATGIKLVPSNLALSLSRTKNGSTNVLRLCIDGRNTQCPLVVETSNDLRRWTYFGTVTNFLGLAWSEGLGTNSKAFFRAKVQSPAP